MTQRLPLFDRVVTTAMRGAEDAVQKAFAATVERELARVLDTAQPGSYRQWIDGKAGAPIAGIDPYGHAYFEFNYLRRVVEFAGAVLRQNSPVDTGRYQRSHTVFVDGVEMGVLTEGADLSFLDRVAPRVGIVIVNTQPYSRLIEIIRPDGSSYSKQAPNGVYRISAATVARRFSAQYRVRSTWVELDDEHRLLPALRIERRD
jgi:hypothetical protein